MIEAYALRVAEIGTTALYAICWRGRADADYASGRSPDVCFRGEADRPSWAGRLAF